MGIREYWGQLSPGARIGLSAGAVAIAAAVGYAAYALLHTGYEPVLRGSNPDKLAAAVRELERQKLPYRVAADGTTLEVPADQAGKARVALSGSKSGAGSAAGFELFNNTDFSTTEFTQKVNYQRALQGELARTIGAIDGVASARVHLVLPESGFLRRQPVRATAAVTVEMEDGQQLGGSQVRGIQKLVAASVPEIRIEDIAVIDHSGVSLTGNRPAEADGNASGRLAFKQEVDSYLEGKLRKLLGRYDPLGEFSVSVDATLNLDEVRVTTEDVLPAEGGKPGSRSTGVVVRERQNSRQDNVAASEPSTGQAALPSSSNVVQEVEYKVGHRVEQVATAPGGIERISVAIVGRPVASSVDVATVKSVVMHAVGANEERGDSIAVVFLPALQEQQLGQPSAATGPAVPSAGTQRPPPESPEPAQAPVRRFAIALAAIAVVLALAGWLAVRRSSQEPASRARNEPVDVDAVAEQIKSWLNDGAAAHGSR